MTVDKMLDMMSNKPVRITVDQLLDVRTNVTADKILTILWSA